MQYILYKQGKCTVEGRCEADDEGALGHAQDLLLVEDALFLPGSGELFALSC